MLLFCCDWLASITQVYSCDLPVCGLSLLWLAGTEKLNSAVIGCVTQEHTSPLNLLNGRYKCFRFLTWFCFLNPRLYESMKMNCAYWCIVCVSGVPKCTVNYIFLFFFNKVSRFECHGHFNRLKRTLKGVECLHYASKTFILSSLTQYNTNKINSNSLPCSDCCHLLYVYECHDWDGNKKKVLTKNEAWELWKFDIYVRVCLLLIWFLHWCKIF